jgi:hypothetical protein
MLIDVEEHVEPYTITRKSDKATFTLDPQFSCTIEVIDDGRAVITTAQSSSKASATSKEKTASGSNQENSKLGMLTNVVKPSYFEDPSIPELEASDLEDFELMGRIKSKKNPSGQATGSTIEWDTMQALLTKEKVVPAAVEEEDGFSDISFLATERIPTRSGLSHYT